LIQGTNLEFGTLHDCSLALAYTVRQYMVGRYLETRQKTVKRRTRVAAYFSAEYLPTNAGSQVFLQASQSNLG
jgi:hypothetical protein